MPCVELSTNIRVVGLFSLNQKVRVHETHGCETLWILEQEPPRTRAFVHTHLTFRTSQCQTQPPPRARRSCAAPAARWCVRAAASALPFARLARSKNALSLVPRVPSWLVSGHRAGWRIPRLDPSCRSGEGRARSGTRNGAYEPAQSAPRRECQFNYLALAHWSTVRFPYMVAPPTDPQQSPKRARVGRALQHS